MKTKILKYFRIILLVTVPFIGSYIGIQMSNIHKTYEKLLPVVNTIDFDSKNREIVLTSEQAKNLKSARSTAYLYNKNLKYMIYAFFIFLLISGFIIDKINALEKREQRMLSDYNVNK